MQALPIYEQPEAEWLGECYVPITPKEYDELTDEEKEEEREYERLAILPFISKTDFWIGMSIWWPVLLALSLFYLLYRAAFHVAKPKGASK